MQSALGRLGDVCPWEDGAIPYCCLSAGQVLHKAVLAWLGLGLLQCFLSDVCQMNDSFQTVTKLFFPWENISLQSGLSKELVIISSTIYVKTSFPLVLLLLPQFS